MDIFSIVSPSYNHELYLAAAIESVLSQAGDFYIDYVIMDGGSADASVDIIKHYEQWLEANCDKQELEELTFYVPRDKSQLVRSQGVSFRWHSGKDNGQADAINTGMSAVKGNYFAYLNSDDLYEPYAFQQALDSFKANSGIDIVYGNAIFIDAEGEITGAYPSKDVNKFDLLTQCYLSQPSVFIKMETVRLAGKFNDKIRNSLDYEYWLRLMSMGAKFKFIKPVLSATRLHDASKTSLNQMRIKIECLAMVEHYNGKIPMSWKIAMMRDASWAGIFSSKFTSGINKLRNIWLRTFANSYYLSKTAAIKAEKKRLFQ